MTTIQKHFHRHYHSPLKRGLLSLALVVTVLMIGTIGMHVLESMPWLEAFYFMSMIATSQGPTLVPATNAGKLFAAFMAFVSVGSVAASLGFLFGPFFGKLFHIGVQHLEEDLHLKKKDSRSS